MNKAAAPAPAPALKATKSLAADRPPTPLRIKQKGNLYARLLSQDNDNDDDEDILNDLPATTPSFRIYYGVAPGAVPFLWESQPGTPKVAHCTATAAAELPPLTPPPSFYFNAKPRPKSRAGKRRPSRFTLVTALFRRLTSSKPRMLARRSPPRPSSSASSVVSSPFTRLESAVSRKLGWSFSSRGEDEHEVDSDDDGSARSVLCFRVQRIARTTLLFRRRRRT